MTISKKALSFYNLVKLKGGNKMELKNESKFDVWRQRFGYGVSDLACNFIWQMITLYLMFFYTDVMKLSPVSIGFMFVVTRIIDGGTDLLIGYCIDHTHTKWGQSRPYFLFGAAPFAIFAVLAFSVPDISQTGKLIYAYITYIGLSFTFTVVNIPMASILPNLTSDGQERTVLSTYRKFFGFLGATIVSATTLKLVDYFGGGNQAFGFRIVMIIFGIAGCLLFWVTFANVKEKVVLKRQHVTLKETLKSLMKNKPWLIFALNILFMWTGYFIQTAALVYYYVAVVQSKELSITIASIMSIVPLCANFMVPFLASKLGKRNLYVSSAFIQLVGIVIIMFGGSQHVIILAGAVVTALGYGMKESIYFSMQADPVDYGKWKTGVDTSGSLSAVNGFLGKVAQAVAGGISGSLLAWGAYNSEALVQSANAILAIKIMYLYIPIFLLVCSIITMLFYKLDEQFPIIKAELEAREAALEGIE